MGNKFDEYIILFKVLGGIILIAIVEAAFVASVIYALLWFIE